MTIPVDARLREALESPSGSDRLKAALDAGTYPNPGFVEALVQRCAIEPDFPVREMLTWALLRHPASLTVPRLIVEVADGVAQGRGQALHTLSKIGDPAGWAAITPELLRDPDDDVARPAWRAAVILAPDDARADVATTLATQLSRGDRAVQHSLSRAFVALGGSAAGALEDARAHTDPAVRMHAIASQRLIDEPDEGFDAALFEAERIVVLGENLPGPRRVRRNRLLRDDLGSISANSR